MAANDTTAIVQSMLSEFGVRSGRVTLLNSSQHCNAKIVSESGSYFLKILASGDSKARLRSRLHFADFLRGAGLPIPAALESKSGRRFASVLVAGIERLGVLYEWIDGETLRDHTEAHWIEMCGELLARLHAHSQFYEPPDDFEVRAWDEVYVPSQGSWRRSFLTDSPVNDEANQIIETAAARMCAINSRVSRDRQSYGLIHADFHGDNLIFDGERIWIVDLDDIGWGHFLFDVAWPAVLFAKHHSDSGEFLEPQLRGYERIRPLGVVQKELLPEFQIAAGIGVIEMVATSPLANDDPAANEWFGFAVRWLRKHLDQDTKRTGS